MTTQMNGKAHSDRELQEHLEVERVVAEGMHTPPTAAKRTVLARMMKLWDELLGRIRHGAAV